jgi:hypothetical protein
MQGKADVWHCSGSKRCLASSPWARERKNFKEVDSWSMVIPDSLVYFIGIPVFHSSDFGWDPGTKTVTSRDAHEAPSHSSLQHNHNKYGARRMLMLSSTHVPMLTFLRLPPLVLCTRQISWPEREWLMFPCMVGASYIKVDPTNPILRCGKASAG